MCAGAGVLSMRQQDRQPSRRESMSLAWERCGNVVRTPDVFGREVLDRLAEHPGKGDHPRGAGREPRASSILRADYLTATIPANDNVLLTLASRSGMAEDH